jgi:hypothetical protein
MLARIKFNWKTTVAGIGSVLVGVGTLAGSLASGKCTPEVLATSVGLINVGIGLIFSKDL